MSSLTIPKCLWWIKDSINMWQDYFYDDSNDFFNDYPICVTFLMMVSLCLRNIRFHINTAALVTSTEILKGLEQRRNSSGEEHGLSCTNQWKKSTRLQEWPLLSLPSPIKNMYFQFGSLKNSMLLQRLQGTYWLEKSHIFFTTLWKHNSEIFNTEIKFHRKIVKFHFCICSRSTSVKMFRGNSDYRFSKII